MHRQLRRLLNDAEGVSEYIIAVNVDIRGFSEFSKQVESPDAAMYVKRVYMRLVDDFLTGSSFFKPTGDGLLLTFPYKENNLKEVFNSTINKCWKVINNFSKICDNDPMINFSVPQNVGIGIARGTACRIIAKNKVLDYSGHVLNLASRLMDVARPRGIVFSDQFGTNLLDSKETEKFIQTKIYLKGIAEDHPVQVFYSKGITKISIMHKSPLSQIAWKKIEATKKLSEFIKLTTFHYKLLERPTDPDEILVEANYPKVVKGKRISDVMKIHKPDYEYIAKGDEYIVAVDVHKMADYAKQNGVKDNWDIYLLIKYPTKVFSPKN